MDRYGTMTSTNLKLSFGTEYIVSKCIQVDPDLRYQNVDELLEDLYKIDTIAEVSGLRNKLSSIFKP